MFYRAKKYALKICEKTLYGNQIAIFLGSGASAAHLSNTSQVTDLLKTWTKYYMPEKSGLGFTEALDALETNGSNNQTTYFQSLYSSLAPNFKDPVEFLHFERLMHVAQGLDYHTSDILNDSKNYQKVGCGPLAPINGNHIGLDNRIHTWVASEATRYILDHFAREEKELIDDGELKDEPFNKFLFKLSKEAYLRLYTLNYDTLPLHSEVDFTSGYVNSNEDLIEESFSPMAVRSAFRRHLFCQLHGSSRFGFNSGNENSRGLVVRMANHEKAIESRKNTSTGNATGQDGIEGLSRLMITGLRKADAILHDPFATYFSQLFDDLIRCKTILVVGYGGGDKHANEIFKRAHDYRTESGLPTRILWITYVHEDEFSSDGRAIMGMKDKPWIVLEQVKRILPDRYSTKGMKSLNEKNKKILFRKKLNIFQCEDVEIGFCFQGSPVAFEENEAEINSFLLGK